jgi:hypothetical protein
VSARWPASVIITQTTFSWRLPARIVAGWPQKFDARRAMALGYPRCAFRRHHPCPHRGRAGGKIVA